MEFVAHWITNVLPFLDPRRNPPGVPWRVLLTTWCLLAVPAAPAGAQDNGGQGPLGIRNLFPPALPYLNFTPERTTTLPAGGMELSYQYARANTFINTQAPSENAGTVIDRPDVEAGLDATDFPDRGYAAFIDVSTDRHLVTVRYGLWDRLELSVEQAWVSFARGGLDGVIVNVEDAFGGRNEQRESAPGDAFGYYLYRDGEEVVATDEPFNLVPQDPVLNVKWNLGPGGAFLPAASVKLSHKQPLQDDPGRPRSYVSSGNADSGVYVLLAKALGSVVGHIQFGQTYLGTKGEVFARHLQHKLFALEFRAGPRHSWLLQLVTQSGLFQSVSAQENPDDFLFSRPTDVLGAGYKYGGDTMQLELGFVEDLNQHNNETDIVFFTTIGARW